MKQYRVVFTKRARENAIDAARYIARASPANSKKWYLGLRKAVNSLNRMPAPCGRARERGAFNEDLRQYIYHSHRIIFRIEEELAIVRVLHIRHAAQRALDEESEEIE